MAWFVLLLVALAFTAVSYLLMPRPKTPKPAAATDLDNPVAEAGKPCGVVQGTITVAGVNVLWFGEKSTYTYEIEV